MKSWKKYLLFIFLIFLNKNTIANNILDEKYFYSQFNKYREKLLSDLSDKKSKLKNKVKKLMEILENDPFTEYPSYKKLCFNLEGAFSRRINLKHRIVYQILPRENTVKILRMWTYYDE